MSDDTAMTAKPDPSSSSQTDGGKVDEAQMQAKTEEERRRRLTPAAQRALAEADERRRLAQQEQNASAAELGGRDGPEPTRYGDWEKDGRAFDF